MSAIGTPMDVRARRRSRTGSDSLKPDTRGADDPGMTHNQQPQHLEPVRLNSRSPWQHRKAWASRLAGLDPFDAEQVALRVRQLLERPANAGRILPV